MDRLSSNFSIESLKNFIIDGSKKISTLDKRILGIVGFLLAGAAIFSTVYPKLSKKSISSSDEDNPRGKVLAKFLMSMPSFEDKLPKLYQIPKTPEYLPNIQNVISNSCPFDSYEISLKDGTKIRLTDTYIRPNNLFFEALFGDTNITTLPGSGKLFKFTKSLEEIRQIIQKMDDKTDITFSAKGKQDKVQINGKVVDAYPLESIYGDASYNISVKEIKSILDSQRIYLSPLLPLDFYRSLKSAMSKDNIVDLPDCGLNNISKDEHPNTHQFLKDIYKNPIDFGFQDLDHYHKVLSLHFYQVGAMVVKTEDYQVFADGNGKIFQRNPDAKDAFRLINACGIRNFRNTNFEQNSEIMTETFRAALKAAEKGIIIFPAIGMGVWGGDPNLYWRSFFDAVANYGGDLDLILVNPNHQLTRSGKYMNSKGEEFDEILEEYLKKYSAKLNTMQITNLRKIQNLREGKQDVLQLARNLKVAYPNTIVSLFNASDPDVTLGYHVGEYVNNIHHTNTTEENYTALGTNGICFEEVTGIHSGKGSKISQVL